MKISTGLAALALVLLVQVTPASAATLQIQFSGLNLDYVGGAAGGTFCDNTSCAGHTGQFAQADPLITMSFIVDGNPVGTLLANIAADVSIPVTGGVSSVVASITPTAGGFFDLLTNAGGFGLQLDLGTGNLVFGPGTVSFIGAAQVTAVGAQFLPFGLTIGMPIVVAYSLNDVTNLTSAGGFVTHADAAGTGEVLGQTVVPEPTSMLLLGTGLAFAARQLRRRRTE